MRCASGFAFILGMVLLVPALATAQNTPPVADAGPDQDILTGRTRDEVD